MKRLLLFFALGMTLLSGCSGIQEKKTGWEEEGLKGKVKSIRTVEYKAIEKSGEVVKDYRDNEYLLVYDEKGNQLEWHGSNSDGDLENKPKLAI